MHTNEDPFTFMKNVGGLVERLDGEVFCVATAREFTDSSTGRTRVVFPARGLAQRASVGAATHYSVGLFPGCYAPRDFRRTIARWSGLWVLLLDDVGTKGAAPEYQPTYKMLTSPGNEQWGYVFDSPIRDQEHARRLVEGLSMSGYSDPGGQNLTRLARLPGSLPPGKTHRARLVEWNTCVHDPEHIHELIGFDLAPTRRMAALETCDLSSVDDPLFRKAVESGHVLSVINDEGWVDVVCPYQAEHTDGEGSARYRVASSTSRPRFMCFHAHSGAGQEGRKVRMRDFMRMVHGRASADKNPYDRIKKHLQGLQSD